VFLNKSWSIYLWLKLIITEQSKKRGAGVNHLTCDFAELLIDGCHLRPSFVKFLKPSIQEVLLHAH